LNAHYERLVGRARSVTGELVGEAQKGHLGEAPALPWLRTSAEAIDHLRATLEPFGGVNFAAKVNKPKAIVGTSGREYLDRRSNELRPSGFKIVRYSVELFLSKYGRLDVAELTRTEGREFLELISQLSPVIGKSDRTRGLTLTQVVQFSAQGSAWITARTQRRIWSHVNHFLDWLVYEGQLEANPFRSVRFEPKVRPAPYAVPTNDEVLQLLKHNDPVLQQVLLTCFLTGMRGGETVGLMREDLVNKANLGWFVHIQPNDRRLLKTDAAERLVPVHSDLLAVFDRLPTEGLLFPNLNVNQVTKRFTRLRDWLTLDQLVFHSTRKWFITQCERTGVPEHWTASLVGHQSARSENGITYSIYSAGISDDQKRSIVDQIQLPT
jgi:integrase